LVELGVFLPPLEFIRYCTHNLHKRILSKKDIDSLKKQFPNTPQSLDEIMDEYKLKNDDFF
jgi:hypothetical protein